MDRNVGRSYTAEYIETNSTFFQRDFKAQLSSDNSGLEFMMDYQGIEQMSEQ